MVFKTVIHRNVRLGEATSYGKSIIDYDVSSKGADNYLKVLLKSENLNLSDFVKTEIVYSEIDAVSLVLSGQADVTLGIASEAEKYQLKFRHRSLRNKS